MSDHLDQLPSLTGLRAFEAAGRHLNFRIAADELGVSQGAVAQQIRALESRLELQLFHRQHRTLAFTEPGKAYHRQVSRAFALLVEATVQVRPIPTCITISVTPTFAAKWLLPRMPVLSALQPGLELRVLATESISNFFRDGIDLAVRQDNPPFGARLTSDLLFQNEIIAVCAPGYRDPRCQPADITGLGDESLLHDTHDLWHEFQEQVLNISSLGINLAGPKFSQTALCIDAALAGHGIALTSRFLVERELRQGRLIQAFEGSLKGEKDFYLVSPRIPKRPAATDKLRQCLIEQAGISL